MNAKQQVTTLSLALLGVLAGSSCGSAPLKSTEPHPRRDTVPLLVGVVFPPLLKPSESHSVTLPPSSNMSSVVLSKEDKASIVALIGRVPNLKRYSIRSIKPGRNRFRPDDIEVFVSSFVITLERGAEWKVYRIGTVFP